jgi:hypothetical protein
MAADALDRRREALQMTSIERMREGLRMGAAQPSDAASEAELDRRAIGQGGLVKKWLGRRQG